MTSVLYIADCGYFTGSLNHLYINQLAWLDLVFGSTLHTRSVTGHKWRILSFSVVGMVTVVSEYNLFPCCFFFFSQLFWH